MRDQETLASGLQTIFRAFLGDVNTAFPAIVDGYDGAGAVDVQPCIMREVAGGESEPLPLLLGVPVLFPGGGGFRVAFPLKPGDEVLIICSQRSLDAWKSAGGGLVEPESRRRFSLSDAVAIPGLLAPSAIGPVGPDAVFEGPGGKITMASDGTVEINGHLKVLP